MKNDLNWIKNRCKITVSDCWIWQGSTTGSRDPRPDIRIAGKHWYVARWVWFIARGDLTKGLRICHTCDNGLCLNPLHLYEATQTENMRDASRRGRFPGKVALTDNLVKQIRLLRSRGCTLQQIADETGVPIGTVGHVTMGTRRD